MIRSMVFLIMMLAFCFTEATAAQTASEYLRNRGGESQDSEDPLIAAFIRTLSASKEGRWTEVEANVSDLTPVLKKYATQFRVDLAPRLKKGAAANDSNEIAKSFAHVLFLGMSENFHQAIEERFKNYERSSYLLATALYYYERVLAGNIKRKEPSVHDEIMRQFEQAQLAIGNPGLLGAGKLDPDPQRFASAAKAIEMNIKRVYTYFAK
ncbi:hypothetical protein MNODULE_20170 [Nitrospiraceae bacterium HYJII51-Mn-bac16s-1-B09]|uniref:Uncharacterized protein n=2 Tax=Candidatus Manganitrophus noduliformans TaxID=2606439 RepID=A0A7X6ID05_9BACT|nr:hypothetical protein [Candidatus Manganitrophus noduliformans]